MSFYLKHSPFSGQYIFPLDSRLLKFVLYVFFLQSFVPKKPIFPSVFSMPKPRDDDLCEYELKRIANINRNLDFLEQLGMLTLSFYIIAKIYRSRFFIVYCITDRNTVL